ncbi:unnamed protein product [Pleuronectes platessa]|uniref:Uncharacterized protein n=1 Tax=Pleuronectes platessa TaxID=8262 RepID=A0A9N7UF92_PLEPL|nr:unnamed protein product [Pleuronectes platessa]
MLEGTWCWAAVDGDNDRAWRRKRPHHLALQRPSAETRQTATIQRFNTRRRKARGWRTVGMMIGGGINSSPVISGSLRRLGDEEKAGVCLEESPHPGRQCRSNMIAGCAG